MNRRHIVFTSDWHVGHKNILKFCLRPYENLDEMHHALIKNYNANTHDSTVGYFLGDMGICSQAVLKEVVDQLRGTKVLILGNHDRQTQSMYNAGFDVVMYGAKIMIQGELVTLTHCPLRGLPREDCSNMKNHNPGDNWHGESRPKHQPYMIDRHDGFHLHGHIHSPNKGRSTKIADKQYDVGVDANNYRPVQMSTIESFITKVKENEKI